MLGLFARLGIFDFPLGIKTSHLSCFDGGLTLGIIEISRNRDHGFTYRVAQVGFGRFLQLAQDHGRDFGRREALAVDVDLRRIFRVANNLVGDQLFLVHHFLAAASHETLDAVHSTAGIGNGLTLGLITYQALALVSERYHAWGDAIAFLIGNHLHLATFHDRYHGIGGS